MGTDIQLRWQEQDEDAPDRLFIDLQNGVIAAPAAEKGRP